MFGKTYGRKRQVEFIDFLKGVDRESPPEVTVIHILCDNVSTHHGKEVRAWLEKHPRFRFHFTPVHCPWMNQVEQWFGILARKRLRIPNFADLNELARKIEQFIAEWNLVAEPFGWMPQSFSRVLAKTEAAVAA